MELISNQETAQGDPVQEEQQEHEQVSSSPDTLEGIEATPDESMHRASILGKLVGSQNVVVSKQNKEDFLNAIITGDRYTEEVTLFGGKLFVRLRCRSVDETKAIMSYLRHEMAAGNVKSDLEYTSTLRTLMIIAQVQEINGVEYPEMEKPLYFTEKDDKEVPPAWAAKIESWEKKPEAIQSAIGVALSEFEGRYWKMIEASADVNFWNPGESTGE